MMASRTFSGFQSTSGLLYAEPQSVRLLDFVGFDALEAPIAATQARNIRRPPGDPGLHRFRMELIKIIDFSNISLMTHSQNDNV
jgi:hypothetical protein